MTFPVETRPPPLRAARRPHFRPSSEREVWTNKKAAGRELDAATTRTAVNAAAKKLMLAKERLKALEVRSGALPVRPRRRAFLSTWRSSSREKRCVSCSRVASGVARKNSSAARHRVEPGSVSASVSRRNLRW